MRDELRNLEDQLNAARAREAQLQQAKTKTKAERDQAIEARRKLLLDGDPDDAKSLAAIDRKLADSERSIAGLADALKLAGERSQQAEHALVAMRDCRRREAEAKRGRRRDREGICWLQGCQRAADCGDAQGAFAPRRRSRQLRCRRSIGLAAK